MKKASCLIVGLALAMCSSILWADSLLRVKCSGQSQNADIYLNGKLMGPCPADIPSPAGQVTLTVLKTEGDNLHRGEKTLTVFDGVPQRVFMEFTQSRKTITALNRDAEAGDIESMKTLAGHYERGDGVTKSPLLANQWRERIENAQVTALKQQAEKDDVSAIEQLIVYYEARAGLAANAEEAARWRSRLPQAEAKAAAAATEADKERRIAELKENSTSIGVAGINSIIDPNGGAGEFSTTIFISMPTMIVSLVSASFEESTLNAEINKIRNEAAVRPSAWAKPGSMMAQVHTNTTLSLAAQ